MYKSVVTVKGQIVIPARLSKKFNITHGTQVIFCERNGKITIKPITDDYLRASTHPRPLSERGARGIMKTCSQCGMLFEEDDVSETGPLEEMTDMFLGSGDSSREAQVCPRCKEELAMLFIAGFGL